ncbi:MAG: permease-like cell division protein FtsX [Ruminococcus sp.]|nr:permease-like cell division protein FtsX [Ruminococcus sp.]
MKFSGFGYLIKEGVKNIWSNRMMSIASVGVLISCLLMTGAASLLSVNVTSAVESVGGENVTRVYLEQEVTDLEAVYITNELATISNVTETVFIPRDDAIKELEDTYSDAIFEQLQGEGNPLPNAVDVTMEDLSLYDTTISQVMAVEGVESIRDTREIAQKLTSLNNLVTTLSFWIVLALTCVSIFIISNTIRMTMYSRRFEISIMKSVGATDTFVRIPFVVEGMTIGLVSGIVTSVLLFFLYDIIMKTAQNIIEFSFVPYSQVGVWTTIVFIGAGVVIGALGSVVSIGRYLKKEGNELLGW